MKTSELRPGDVVRLEGGEWPLTSGDHVETTVIRVNDDGTADVVDPYDDVPWSIDDGKWPFVLVRRAGEATEAADTETFTARVGTVKWAQHKDVEGALLERRNSYGEWTEAAPLGFGDDDRGEWRVKPAPVVAPTLEECLAVLEATYESGQPNFRDYRLLLARAKAAAEATKGVG